MLSENIRYLRKLNKLVEQNNFLYEAWCPLIDNITNKEIQDFLFAARGYIEYMITVKYDGRLPRKSYEHFSKVIDKCDDETKKELLKIVKKIEDIRKKIKQARD